MLNRTIFLDYFLKRDRGWLLSLTAAVCLVYLPFLGNEFFFDDLSFFMNGIPGRYAEAGFHFDLRWFAYASLGWTVALFSDVVPHFFHLGNLLLHAANAILLFYLLRQLICAVFPDRRDSSMMIWGAWLGALLFALHPVAVYAVGYVVQRSILMATLFALLAQMAYLRGLLTGQGRWLALAVLCYFLAVFSKEHSVLTPLVLAALTPLLGERNIASNRALWVTWSAFLLVAVLVTLRARGIFGTPYEPMAAELFEQQGVLAGTPELHLLSMLTQTGLFFKYLLLWLLPNVSWMSVDMREPFVANWADWNAWIGLLAFTVYGAAAIRLLLRGGTKGLIGFALLYPWLQFGVELVGIRVQEPFVLYRSYLWMPGLLLLIPLLLLQFQQRRSILILGCVAILLVPLAWNRLWVFGDQFRLWNDAALLLKDERVFGADRIFFNRGQGLMEERKWEEAARDFERSAAISPKLEPVHYSLGMAYSKAGRYQEALDQFEAAISIQPKDGRAYFAEGIALKRLNRNEEAIKKLEQGCRLNNFPACLLISASQGGKK
ncbi:lipoprotein NlpI [mine drainage metagenome]|uniref:Lipoprotein NlpI n=1 Tax=mine drainage metagenome TaxID=410659 RepID=A0A1J5TI19_9ZZZZ